MEIKDKLAIVIKELKARRKKIEIGTENYDSYSECIEKLEYLTNNIGLLGKIKTCKIIHFDNYDDEVWKPVKEADEGLYEVSNKMRVRNLSSNRILQPYLNDGYNNVNLKRNGKMRHCRFNRVVASAFIPNPENKPFVDHINSNSLDDRPENLRWVTQEENMSNNQTLENMTGVHGYPILQYSLDGEFINEWENAFIAARTYGWSDKSSSNIRHCCLKDNYSKTYKGFIWKFKKDVPPEKRYIKQDDASYYISVRSSYNPVLQFSLDNILIAEYKSATEAARIMGYDSYRGICKCCNGKSKDGTFNGYIWKRKFDLNN